MNNSYQAKGGLKTFVFALVVSLGVFAVFYYLTSYPSEAVDIEEHSEMREEATLEEARKTAFRELANEEISVPVRTVLGGADTTETTQSSPSVPDTGISSITIALMGTFVAFVLAGYLIYIGPRNLALSRFEDSFK